MGESTNRKVIVVSAVNFFEGGPLSILKECLEELNTNFANQFRIIALISSKQYLDKKYENIELIEYPLIRTSWIKRLKFEYYDCKEISKKLNPYLWFSLHDITPNVFSERKVVYCHNPSPFYKATLAESKLDLTFFLFNKFYKYLYRINISTNNFVVVQSDWMRQYFEQTFGITNVVVAYPQIKILEKTTSIFPDRKKVDKKFIFFYPAFPRVFKNFEVVLSAAMLLQETRNDFEIYITVSGNENKYAEYLYQKYKGVSCIKWLGKITREQVFEYYQQSDCLIFPSKLETWGLPISEAIQFGKPIIAADLPYAHETSMGYEKIHFFNPTNASHLATVMQQLMDKELVYSPNEFNRPQDPFCEDWNGLFKILF